MAEKRLKISFTSQAGLAMPVALLLVMSITIIAAVYARSTIQTFNIAKSDESASDTFLGAEGAVQSMAASMAVQPHLWRTKTTLSDTPEGYTTYAPANYSATNGIPNCTGSAACQRNLVPTGGGLIKNFGPIGAEGESANTSLTISEQLDLQSPPPADLTLNNRPAWVQVERLDQTLPSASTVGGELSNNPVAGNTASLLRFRITGIMAKQVKGRQGTATVVSVVEMPVS